MTKNLKWRLSKLPSGGEVASLVEQKVITTQEAKDILFSNEKEEEIKDGDLVKSLKKQVEFLEGLVKELASNNHGTVYVDRYVRAWPKWDYYYATSGNLGAINAVSNLTLTSASTTKDLTPTTYANALLADDTITIN